jgi:hypothetical protein
LLQIGPLSEEEVGRENERENMNSRVVRLNDVHMKKSAVMVDV